jgi:hypothetical protein
VRHRLLFKADSAVYGLVAWLAEQVQHDNLHVNRDGVRGGCHGQRDLWMNRSARGNVFCQLIAGARLVLGRALST